MKRSISQIFFSILLLFSSVLTQCSNNSLITEEFISNRDERSEIYNLYVSQGGTLTYDDWLDTIKGEDGSKLFCGTSNPDNSCGKNGDIYINTTNWDFFTMVDGAWTLCGNIMGKQGEKGDTIIGISKIRVCSYNVGHYDYGIGMGYEGADIQEAINKVKGVILNLDADIIAIQEDSAFFDANGFIDSKETLYAPLYKYSVTNYSCYLASNIYSKYPISSFSFGVLHDGNRNYSTASLDIGGHTINLFNFHLSTVKEERDANFKEILALVNNMENVIMCADWNVADVEEFDLLKNKGFKLANGGYLPFLSTYGLYDFYFDNIVFSNNIYLSNFNIPCNYDDGVSDHLPIVADLIVY